MKTSKYLNKQFGSWTCTHVGVARIQPKFYEGTKKVSPSAGTMTYYYIFERKTSDNKADKLVRLSAKEAARVYRGETTVEEIADARVAKNISDFTRKVSYHFFTAK